jgi:hypothetical protein
MNATTSASALATNHDEWISCSHWGMFHCPERRADLAIGPIQSPSQ